MSGGGAGAVGIENDEQAISLEDPGSLAQHVIEPGPIDPPPPPSDGVWTDREYIYGPDDVDEFICQTLDAPVRQRELAALVENVRSAGLWPFAGCGRS